MNVIFTLKVPAEGIEEKTAIRNVNDRNDFSFVDAAGCACHVQIFENGIIFVRKAQDHMLELHAHGQKYVMICSPEGNFRIEMKVVEFIFNNDILVMRYQIDKDDREIEIRYLQELKEAQ